MVRAEIASVGVFIRGSGINSTYVNANDVIIRGQGVGLYEYDALGSLPFIPRVYICLDSYDAIMWVRTELT